ncbi:MAG: helix-turn-helix domain-containing protein [Oscillospiraceae bacterium]|nr:helix-turn-helix domain-containing protein [Oscillospiraceae bacterium]MDE6132084.1 helix-turn-helix domain-containing protein [Oscillospiraceae bacterium]
MDMIAIGGRIKAERKRLGISQERLAETVSVSPHYIYEIERGMKAMSLETLINIINALEISADYLLFGKQQYEAVPLCEQLQMMSEERRLRAENAFKALLPYIN